MAFRLRVSFRLALGPLAVALLVSLQLLHLGGVGAIAVGYVAFLAAVVGVDVWGKHQLRVARRRLRACRLARTL